MTVNDNNKIKVVMKNMGEAAIAASQILATVSNQVKNIALHAAAHELRNQLQAIKSANAETELINKIRWLPELKIDSEDNNTEDPDATNNVDIFDVCVGDCSQPDLKVKDTGPQTLSSMPVEPVAGTIVSFTYSITS